MKAKRRFFNLLLLSCIVNISAAQVNIKGDIAFDTILTKSLSPYYVVGDIIVPEGITLSIEPGVELKYTGNFELLVKGKLVANGNASDTIVFCSDTEGIKKGKRFIKFENTDLTNHQLSYIKILDGTIGLQVGEQETELSQKIYNTGKLNISHFVIRNSGILSYRAGTGSEILMEEGIIDRGEIRGANSGGEKITLKGLKISNSTLISDSYSKGIWMEKCDINATVFKAGCCGAAFNISESIIEEGSFLATNQAFEVSFYNSRIVNFPINLSLANKVTIVNSYISGQADHILRCNNLTMQGTVIKGLGTAIGLDVSGTSDIKNVTIDSFGVGIKVELRSKVTITGSSFSRNAVYNIENISEENVLTPNNWWGTSDIAIINAKIYDKHDDINKGEVIYSPLLTEDQGLSNFIPVVNNCITPLFGEAPLSVIFTSSAIDIDGAIKLYQWDFDGDSTYDYSSNVDGPTTYIYKKGGYIITESKITDNTDLASRNFYRIAVIDFSAKSEALDNKIIVNWGWGNFHTVIAEASAFNFLSAGDTIHVIDQSGMISDDCATQTVQGKISVASQVYSAENDSFYVFNSQPYINNCVFNSTMRSGYVTGHQMTFEVKNGENSFVIKPVKINSGTSIFEDSAFTWISKFEKSSLKSAPNPDGISYCAETVNRKDFTFNVYRNKTIYRTNVEELFIMDRDVTANNEYCYEIYVVDNGSEVLSKSTCAQIRPAITSAVVPNLIAGIYPNPSNYFVTVTTSEATDDLVLYLCDVCGHELFKQRIESGKTEINISGLPVGIYLIKLANGRTLEVKKIIKE